MHAFTERAETASSGEGEAWKCRSNCIKVHYWLAHRLSGLTGRAGDGLEMRVGGAAARSRKWL